MHRPATENLTRDRRKRRCSMDDGRGTALHDTFSLSRVAVEEGRAGRERAVEAGRRVWVHDHSR